MRLFHASRKLAAELWQAVAFAQIQKYAMDSGLRLT